MESGGEFNKTGAKLKIIRILNGMSQKELSILLKVSVFHIAAIEEGKKKLTQKRAELLFDEFNISVDWLLDSSVMMLERTGFALFSYSGSKTVSSAYSSQSRWKKMASNFVVDHLPLLIGPTYDYCSASFDSFYSSNVIIFVVFRKQALILSVIDSRSMVKNLKTVFNNINGPRIIENYMDLEMINEIGCYNPEKIIKFINECKIDEELRGLFADEAKSCCLRREKMRNSLRRVDAVKEFENSLNMVVTERICNELMRNNIPVTDLIELLHKNKRQDLLQGVCLKLESNFC